MTRFAGPPGGDSCPERESHHTICWLVLMFKKSPLHWISWLPAPLPAFTLPNDRFYIRILLICLHLFLQHLLISHLKVWRVRSLCLLLHWAVHCILWRNSSTSVPCTHHFPTAMANRVPSNLWIVFSLTWYKSLLKCHQAKVSLITSVKIASTLPTENLP